MIFFKNFIHPFCYFTLFFCTGIALFFTQNVTAYLWTAAFSLFLLYKNIIKPHLFAYCALGAIAGYISICCACHSWKTTRLSLCHKKSFIATVVSTEQAEKTTFPYATTLQLIHHADSLFTLPYQPKLLAVYTREKPNISIGDIVYLKNIHIQQEKNAGFQLYLQKEGLIGATYRQFLSAEKIGAKNLIFIPRLSHLLRERQVSYFSKNLSAQCFTFFAPLFLGKKLPNSPEKKALYDAFSWWGISHHLARSGLHMVICLGLCTLIMTLLGISLQARSALSTLFITLYVLASFAGISFIRATLTSFIYLWCSWRKLTTDTLYIVCAITLTVLLHNPFQLFFLDFQLSFLLTAGLAFLSKKSRAP